MLFPALGRVIRRFHLTHFSSFKILSTCDIVPSINDPCDVADVLGPPWNIMGAQEICIK